MGTCTEAILSWGFVIPENQLVALLEVFRKHKQGQDPRESTDHVDGPSAKKLKTGITKKKNTLSHAEEDELVEYVDGVIESTGISRFIQCLKSDEPSTSLTFQYQDEFDEETGEMVKKPYKIDRWGSDNDGASCIALGPTLTAERMFKGMEGKMEELKAALHFKEANIEVEEQWILTAQIN